VGTRRVVKPRLPPAAVAVLKASRSLRDRRARRLMPPGGWQPADVPALAREVAATGARVPGDLR
jgi:hypothetical protein